MFDDNLVHIVLAVMIDLSHNYRVCESARCEHHAMPFTSASTFDDVSTATKTSDSILEPLPFHP